MEALAAPRRLLACLVVLLPIASGACAIARSCPATPEQAIAGEFAQADAHPYRAAVSVIRFVPARNAPESRGYDLAVHRTFAGQSDSAMFLRVDAEVAGVRPRMRALLVAAPGPRREVVVSVGCPPLMPVSDDLWSNWIGE